MTIEAALIREAILDRLSGAIAGVRHVADRGWATGTETGQNAQAERGQVLTAPRFAVSIDGFRNHPATAAGNLSSSRLVELEVSVEFRYHLPAQIDEGRRHVALDEMLEDGDAAAQALSYPGALDQTANGVATDIVSGVMLGLAGAGMPEWERTEVNWSESIARAQLRGLCVLQVTQATS